MGTGVAVRGAGSPRASTCSLGSCMLLGFGFGHQFPARLSPTKRGDAALAGQGVQPPQPRRCPLVSNSPRPAGLLHPARLVMELGSACPEHGEGTWLSTGPQHRQAPSLLCPSAARPPWGNLTGANCICSMAENNKLLSERVLVKAGWRPGLAHPGEHP